MTIEDEVRAMLRARAGSIEPSRPDDAPADATATARRRRPTFLLAAAALVVVTLVGAVVVARRDDADTSVETGPVASAPTAGGATPLLDAVWPTADGEELRAGAPPEVRHQYPWAAARLYLQQRIGVDLAEDEFSLVSGDATHAVLRDRDGVLDSEVAMRRLGTTDDPIWYVVNAKSPSVSVGETSYDGERARGFITALDAGELTLEVEPADFSDPVISIPVGEVDRGEAVELDEALPDESGVVIRAILRAPHVVAMGEVLVVEEGTDIVELTPEPAQPTAAPDGVWPWPDDAVAESVLDDPVDTARAYVATRVLDAGATIASDFRAADATSGEVVFTGDVATTVFVRRLDRRWHVEASASDLVTAHGLEDGTTTIRFETGGEVTHIQDSSVDADDAAPETFTVRSGDERRGIGYTFGRDDVVVRHSFVLRTADGPTALAEIALRRSTAGARPVPDDAVSAEGGLDPVEVARAYLADRLGREPAVEGEPADGGTADTTTVEWEAGHVALRRVDGLWYVIEAVGDSVQIAGYSRDVGYIGGTVVVAEPGTLFFTAGETSWVVPVEHAAEGTRVPFEHEIDDETSMSLRVVFETSAGSVSLAEQPL